MKTASELCKAGEDLGELLDRWCEKHGLATIEAIAVVSAALSNQTNWHIVEAHRLSGLPKDRKDLIIATTNQEIERLLSAIHRERSAN